MDFQEVIDGIVLLLESRGRVTYRGLKRQFNLDDDYLEDIKYELIKGMQLAHDEDGEVLVWNNSHTATIDDNEFDKTGAVNNSQQAAPAEGILNHTSHAERRQLTVMFCDLVGSTELSTILDPEELHELLQVYQLSVGSEVKKYKGHIAQYLGDGILVYFGYPQAHEDDPQRAILAALGAIESIKEKNQILNIENNIDLRIRIGIHTGLVVVGDVGEGLNTEQLALGDTPNIAARIQNLTEPNTIVISQTTHRLAGSHFNFKKLGSSQLKGVKEEISLFQVLSDARTQHNFNIDQLDARAGFIGRETEIKLLVHRWSLCKQGLGQIIMISGEPGIGKSRLISTISKHVSEDDAFRIILRCSPYHANSAYYPILNFLETTLDFSRDDTPASKLAKLETFLSESSYPVGESVPLVASLLSIPLDTDYPANSFSSERKKQIIKEIFSSIFLDKAKEKPLLLIWEDLHWADPSTLDVIGLITRRIESENCLCLLNHRPEFQHHWQSHANITQLFLERLTDEQMESMVNQITDSKSLPKDLLARIISKTDGVPLFVEQVINQVLESGILEEKNGHYELTAPLDLIAVPMTLQDSLMARLDNSVSSKRLAQLGSALGREFSFELISAVSGLENEILLDNLSRLVKIQILHAKGTPPQCSYFFRHALIQDVAYHSVLKKERKGYHKIIAQVLEKQFNNDTKVRPELLAHHHTEAGNNERATTYWHMAGEIAIRQSAHEEAIAHLRKGLEVLKSLPEDNKKLATEIMLQISLGAPLTATKGYCAEEVDQTYQRARTLSENTNDIPYIFRALYGLWRLNMLRAKYAIAKNQAAELLELSKTTHNDSFPTPANRAMGATLFYMGEFEDSLEHTDQVINVGKVQSHMSEVLIADIYDVVDPRVTCLSYAAWTSWMLGYPEKARRNMQNAVDLADKLAHPFSIALAQSFASWFYQFSGNKEKTQQCALKALTISQEQGFKFWVGWDEIMIAWL